MKLSALAGINHGDVEIRGLCFDSRQVRPGDAFFAIRGHAVDGHQFLADVVRRGPAAIVVEDRSLVPADFKGAVIVVRNSRAALDAWATLFFGSPGEKLFIAGVTGTNGKTSSVYMLEKVFNQAGKSTGVIGTIDHHVGQRVWETSNTTPDPITLQTRLQDFVKHGAQAAAFEITSIALDQERANTVPYDAGIFTNFTRDHLDYHGTMEKYFLAKQKFFLDVIEKSSKNNVFAVLNGDDEWIRKLQLRKRVRPVFFGSRQSDYQFRIRSESLAGSRFVVTNGRSESEVWLATPGRHNVYNAVGVFALAAEAGIGTHHIADAFADFTGAPGRLQSVPNDKGLIVFVDYAHTDDALRAVLKSVRNLMQASRSEGRLWIVFGCGGDRDKGKRPLMAQAAVESSDCVVLTSDNPRTEDPQAIIRDCLSGVPGAKVFAEPDRKKAIAFALQTAREGDVILIAGKGHENYQIIGRTKYPFSDFAVVKELLN